MSFIGQLSYLELQNLRTSKLEFIKVISPPESHILSVVLNDDHLELLEFSGDRKIKGPEETRFSVWIVPGIRKYILYWYGVCITVSRYSSIQFPTLT